MRKITLIIVLLSLFTSSFAQTPPLHKTSWLYLPTLQFGGGYQNHDNSFIYGKALLPILPLQRVMLYIEFNGIDREGPSLAGDIGTGIRMLSSNRQWLYDVHANYDRLKSRVDNRWFSQYIIGSRLQTEHWDFQANGYLPDNNDIVPTSAAGTKTFHNVQMRDGMVRIMPGLDAEMGYRPGTLPGLGIYAGGYWFHAKGMKTVAGPQMHVSYDLHNPLGYHGGWANLFYKIGIDTGTYYDPQNKFAWHASLRWTVAFDTDDLTGMEKHMSDLNTRLFD